MKKLFFLLLIIFAGMTVDAQYFQTGQDPASIKWRQINTENFQLIYPDYFELQAQKLAYTLKKVYKYGSYTLNHKPEKISVILHTQTVKSNGLVAYAPKRSEFYTTPHQAIYPQNWLEQLALHEFRHVVQIDKLNSELPKIIKILLGEQGTALVFGAYLPWWFIEGDAVVTETTLSNFGRGRFPSFLMEHKAQMVEKGRYSYDKAYNGSYQDFVPDHYKLGYHLVANSRAKYGSGLWNSVLKRVGDKPFSFTPFNKALKLKTGMNKVQLYNSVFDSLALAWQTEDKNLDLTVSKIISQQKQTYTNYRYSHWLNNSEIIVYKTALDKIPAFVKIDKNGKEETILHPGVIFAESINHRKEWIVWAEQTPDLRWSHSGRSEISLFNINNRKRLKVKPEFKAFAPAISPDMNNVAVVESDFSSNYYLSVYRVSDGKLLHRIQTSNNNYFFTPEWVNDREIVSILLTPEGKRIARFDLQSGKHKILIKKDLGEIKHLRVVGNNIYFISGYSGKNCLYVYNTETDLVHHIYEPRFGVEAPTISPNGQKAILSDYTADGFQLIEIKLKKENLEPISDINENRYVLADQLTKHELGIPELNSTDSTVYDSKKYRKINHLFNFHSWAPAFVDIGSYDIQPGVSLMSQNKLGTAETILGYRWDVSEKTGEFYANYKYKGWFPVLDFELSSGKRASQYMLVTESKENDVVVTDTALQRFTWNETNFQTDIKVPLNLSRGAYYRFLQPEINYDFTFYKKDNTTPDNFFEGNFQSVAYRLYFHQLRRQSYQDVYPNFGFIIDGIYRHSPFGSENLGEIMAGQAVVYFPGVIDNHGIKAYGGAQTKHNGGMFSFSDMIRYPRGWGRTETKEMYSFAFDYKMPLFNPDWSLGSLAYIRRINASLFADYARLFGNNYDNGGIVGTFETDISSFGLELTGDMNFLRFYAPLNIGFRTSWLPEVKKVYFDFLFSIDFTSL
ncbi:MAG: hypothetical protein ABFS16_07275 [Bacteroidota bacterium]